MHRVASRNPRIDEFIPNYTKVSKDWKSIIEHNDINGLILAVPPSIQPLIAQEAIKRRIPLLLEKPLALSFDEARKMQYLAIKNDVLVMVDHIYLFHPAFMKLKEKIVNEGSPILEIESISGNYGPFRDNCTPLWDWGPHDMSMCFDIVKDSIEKLYATETKTSLNNLRVGKSYVVRIQFSSGCQANLQFGNSLRKKTRLFKVRVNSGQYIFNEFLEKKLVFQDKEGNLTPIEIESQKPLNNLVQIFNNRIKNSCGYLTDMDSSIEVIKELENIDNNLNTN